MTDSTGPKISSWAMVILLSTSANTVGSMNHPVSCAVRPPPVVMQAPSLRPDSISPRIRSRAGARPPTGPTCVVASSGSPTVKRPPLR
ncbi:MAG: hypothetical protein R2711_03365 [Acidimicrobiales bacterium]